MGPRRVQAPLGWTIRTSWTLSMRWNRRTAELGKHAGIRLKLKLVAKRPATSAMGGLLKGQYLPGRANAQELVDAARASGTAIPELHRLSTGKLKHRVRRGKRVVDSRGAAQRVRRLLEHDTNMHKPLRIPVPVWDDDNGCQVERPLDILPPHETLDSAIQPGREDEWTSFDAHQAGFKDELGRWATRLHTPLEGSWACLSLWGG